MNYYSYAGVFCQSFSPPTDDICPGDNVTFTCVVVDDDGFRFTRWIVTPGGTVPSCTVTHTLPEIVTCGPMNSFTSSLTGTTGTSYTTTLSVESISDSFNGTIVECTNSTGGTIGSDDICIVGEKIIIYYTFTCIYMYVECVYCPLKITLSSMIFRNLLDSCISVHVTYHIIVPKLPSMEVSVMSCMAARR